MASDAPAAAAEQQEQDEDGEEEEDEEEEDFDEDELSLGQFPAEDIQDDGYSADTAIIIDNGSGMCKAGMGCNPKPDVRFPEIVGRPRPKFKNVCSRDVYVGNDVIERLDKLSVQYPLSNGIIEDPDAMQEIWEHIFFEQLKVNPQRHPLLLTEPPFNPKPARERMAEIMFETFQVPALNISIQGVLALLGQGRTTGMVLDSGEGVTHTIPVWEGYGINRAIRRSDVAGRELNILLSKFIAMQDPGISLTKTKEQHWVRKIKEDLCYVAQDPRLEFAEEKTYQLPDGRRITLGEERWKTPEALFRPTMLGFEAESCFGVANMVWDSAQGCDIDLRTPLLGNIVLSGGSTMFPGFVDRLLKDLKHCAPSSSQARIRVVSNFNEYSTLDNAVWQGAQVFASLRELQPDSWITMDDWFEYGNEHLHSSISVKYH